jgi:hypothetical protein
LRPIIGAGKGNDRKNTDQKETTDFHWNTSVTIPVSLPIRIRLGCCARPGYHFRSIAGNERSR